MAGFTSSIRTLVGTILVFSLSVGSSEAAYTREQCAPSIRDALRECKCLETRRGYYVDCQLGNVTYRQFPELGQLNKTITRVELHGGYIGNFPAEPFGKLAVSVNVCEAGITDRVLKNIFSELSESENHIFE